MGLKMNIKIMITDNHLLIREGIKRILEELENIEIVGESGNIDDCIEMLKYIKFDILILDINMPNNSAYKIIEYIRNNKLLIKILILTENQDIYNLIRSIELGVNGYILKECDINEFKKCIYQVNNGEQYVQHKLHSLLDNKLLQNNRDNDKIKLLTKRELEVLKQVSLGMFNKEIALSLNISERTVKNHVSNIFKKIDVNDRTQAAVFAIRNKIVSV